MTTNPTPEPDKNKPQTNQNFAAKYSSLVFQMLVIIAVGVFGGIKLDQWLNTDPIFTIILSMLSIIGGIFIVIKDFIIPKK